MYKGKLERNGQVPLLLDDMLLVLDLNSLTRVVVYIFISFIVYFDMKKLLLAGCSY